MVTELHFDGSTPARGRNGVFCLRRGRIALLPSATVSVELFSSREGNRAPIALTFRSPAELRTLAQALLEAADAVDPSDPPAAGAISPAHYTAQGGGCCTVCGSGDLRADGMEMDGPVAWQPITCLACGAEWNDLYRLQGYDDLTVPASSKAQSAAITAPATPPPGAGEPLRCSRLAPPAGGEQADAAGGGR